MPLQELPVPQTAIDDGCFRDIIESIDGTPKIKLLKGEQILASRTVSLHAPTVTVLSPNAGESYTPGQTVRLRWSGADADEDTLTYTLAVSRDDGDTWLPIAMDIGGSTYDLPTAYMGPGRYSLRVMASDGVNTGEDLSDQPFTILRQLYLPVVIRQ